jgi:hypothetical protein
MVMWESLFWMNGDVKLVFSSVDLSTLVTFGFATLVFL